MAKNSERIEEAVNSPLAYWDREKGGSLEREALTRNRRGIILFTSPEDAQDDSGEAWDSIYSSRWEGQEARVEEEVAAVEPRWQCLHDLPYFSHLRVVTEGLSPGARALECNHARLQLAGLSKSGHRSSLAQRLSALPGCEATEADNCRGTDSCDRHTRRRRRSTVADALGERRGYPVHRAHFRRRQADG